MIRIERENGISMMHSFRDCVNTLCNRVASFLMYRRMNYVSLLLDKVEKIMKAINREIIKSISFFQLRKLQLLVTNMKNYHFLFLNKEVFTIMK